MEFLMTYGWAILVVLAAIGALAYFGVLSPDKFLPDKCTASPPFTCSEYKAQYVDGSADIVTLVLQQNSGTNFENVTVFMEHCVTELTNNTAVANGDKAIFAFDDCDTGNSGSKFKATFNMTYWQEDGAIDRTVSGTIQTKVE